MGEEEKQRLIFEQNCQDFRSLNEIMWRVPVIVITLTGGLWFGVASLDISNPARIALLVLSGVANIIFVLVLVRLRYIMGKLLSEIKEFKGLEKSQGYIVVVLFSIVLVLSSVFSFVAACMVKTFFE